MIESCLYGMAQIIQNVTQELLAGYIAGSVGNPKDFIITYSTTHNFSLQVKQYE